MRETGGPDNHKGLPLLKQPIHVPGVRLTTFPEHVGHQGSGCFAMGMSFRVLQVRPPDLMDSAPVSFEPEPSEAEPEPDLRSNHRRAGQFRICSAFATPWKSVVGSGGLRVLANMLGGIIECPRGRDGSR
ncbi:MAG: hypothetical protein MUF54_20855, partial [Polyangiaceae bacterium]|nr:hypothetical protein [Polyangiaceae bacterium]